MFLLREQHPYSGMRISTVTTAYEDCVCLSSLGYIAKVLGVTVTELLPYFFSSLVGKDIFRMEQPNQEIDCIHSYFTHFRAFSICPKSPYSASANPHANNLIHLIGALAGDARSLNATSQPEAAINDMAILAGYIAEFFLSTGKFSRAILGEGEESEDEDDSSDDESLTGSATGIEVKERTPGALYKYVKSQGSKMQPISIERYQTVVRKRDPRAGTIAAWITDAFPETGTQD